MNAEVNGNSAVIDLNEGGKRNRGDRIKLFSLFP
jgi:hypothetical protein